MKSGVLFFLAAALICGAVRKVPVYDAFSAGAEEGLKLAVRILPALIPMLCAVTALSASGLMTAAENVCAPVMEALGLPREVLPLLLMRPLSGSASLAMVRQLMETYGADSRVGLIACTLMGSSETLFYVLAVYMGAVHVKKTRHVIPCALFAWIVGSLAAGLVWRVF